MAVAGNAGVTLAVGAGHQVNSQGPNNTWAWGSAGYEAWAMVINRSIARAGVQVEAHRDLGVCQVFAEDPVQGLVRPT